MIPKLDGEYVVESTMSLNCMLQVACPSPSNLVSGLERQEPIFSASRRAKGNTSDCDDNNCNPSDVSDHDSGSLDEETQNRELFNDWKERGYDDSIPGESPKQPLPEIRLHDPLHGRQACPELKSFHQGVGQICPRQGLFLCRPLPKRDKIVSSPPPPIVERV